MTKVLDQLNWGFLEIMLAIRLKFMHKMLTDQVALKQEYFFSEPMC